MDKKEDKQTFGEQVRNFDHLVEKNRSLHRPWYYGIRGNWWWGMTESEARTRLKEAEKAFEEKLKAPKKVEKITISDTKIPGTKTDIIKETKKDIIKEIIPGTKTDIIKETKKDIIKEIIPETKKDIPETKKDIIKEIIPETKKDIPETKTDIIKEIIPETKTDIIKEIIPETKTDIIKEIIPEIIPETKKRDGETNKEAIIPEIVN